MKTRTLLPLATAVSVAVALPLAAVAQAGPVAQAAATKTVTMKGISLNPKKVTISKGSKVKWVWKDGSIRHDVTWSNGGFKDSKLQSKGSYTVTFKKKGTFKYICSVHPGDMKGSVVVK